MKQLYVGNIPFQTSEFELKILFEQFGEINDIKMIKDVQNNQPKAFCFIEMNEEAADKAISHLNQSKFGGRNLIVSEAKQQK